MITAHGNAALFADVRDLVTAAPAIDSWFVTALKPPQGWKFTHQRGDVCIDVKHAYFEALQSSNDPDQIAIRIYCAEFSAD